MNPFRLVCLGLLSIFGLLGNAFARDATARQAASGAPQSRPNIVFMMADDLGWADVGFHGGSAPTPNLDALAAEGLELTQHYVAPVCSPTRSGLMTGRCWSRFGVTGPQNELALPRATVTLAHALKSAGYTTCLTGKWHLGSLPDQGPNHYGFDHSYGSLAGGVSPWNHRYKQGPFTQTWHRNETLIDEPGHVTDLIAAEAVQWIESRDKDPFFLYVPMTAVHLPVKEPAQWVEQVPQSIQGDVARHYAASIMHLDDVVGKITAALERTRLQASTLLVFTSDNGGSTAENNDLKYPDDNCPDGKLPGNNKPLRGEKGSLYEGGTRVPTIVFWPNGMKSGTVSSPVQITDWMPTFCHLAGYQAEHDLKWDGVNIAPLLTDHAAPAERAIYSVGPGWRSRSLRRGDWKLIVVDDRDIKGPYSDAFEASKSGRKVELYNIASDPHETKNEAAAYPETRKQLLSDLVRMAGPDRDAVAIE